jgi:cell wall-associated NlpC family hydrolase
MFRKFSPFVFVVLMASCTSMKPLTFTNNKQTPVTSTDNNKKEIQFLDISSADNAKVEAKEIKKDVYSSGTQSVKSGETSYSNGRSSEIEKATSLQLKYSQLLNTEVEQVQNIPLYRTIDDWYGTRYKLGGTTKTGIDCSAFVQTIFISVFGITLPRTARDQYIMTQHISRTELQEGDLLFFNTRGGVSHVGIYLQNNKFVHASISGGVTISDMFEPYYVKHFIASGRVKGIIHNSSVSINP